MKTIHTVTDIAQVRILSDPLKMRILEQFCCEARTTKQVAVILEEKPTKLYHHVDALERSGLIKLVKTRKKRGTQEKYFRGIAQGFRIDQSLLRDLTPDSGISAELEQMVLAPLESTISDIRESVHHGLIRVDTGGRRTLLARMQVKVREEDLPSLQARMQEWLAECGKFCEEDEGSSFGLTLALYPKTSSKDS